MIKVPPIAVRPSVMLPGSTTLSEDDITFALSNILKVNITITGDVPVLTPPSRSETPRQGEQRPERGHRYAADLLQ